jgi:hypothetical protein
MLWFTLLTGRKSLSDLLNRGWPIHVACTWGVEEGSPKTCLKVSLHHSVDKQTVNWLIQACGQIRYFSEEKKVSVELAQRTLLLQIFTVQQIQPTIQLCDYRGSSSGSNNKIMFKEYSYTCLCLVHAMRGFMFPTFCWLELSQWTLAHCYNLKPLRLTYEKPRNSNGLFWWVLGPKIHNILTPSHPPPPHLKTLIHCM